MNEYFKVITNPDSPLEYLITTNINVWNDFLYHFESKEYMWGLKRWRNTITEDSVGYNWEDNSFCIGKGFGIYIYNRFKDFMDEESINLLDHDIWIDSKLSEEFDYRGLRDDQISLVKELFQYRRAIVQVPTGFGKTEIIARLVMNMAKMGKRILVATGLGKVVDEIKNRIWYYNSDLYIPDYWDEDSLINIINPKGFASSNVFNPEDKFLRNVDIVVCDEVSSSTNDSNWAVYTQIINPDCIWYGFDATAEKEKGDRLDIRENLNCIHSENSVYVINLFGMSWIFSKPVGYKVDLIEVSNIGLREISSGLSEQEFSDTAVYRSICNYVFCHPEYIKTVEYILEKYNKLFIPMNDLEYIDTMVDAFKDKYSIATITGSGYWSSEEGDIDLERFKYLTQENKVNLVLSSSAGFKGLDFRGIPNVLLTLGVKAGTVIQFVGRVARQKHFRVIAITAGGSWKIPIYSKHNIKQLDLIMKYYEDCNLNYIEDKYE